MDADPQLDLDLATLRHLTRQVRSSAARAAWRAATLERTTRVALVLLVTTSAVMLAGATRTKTPAGWAFFAPASPKPIVTVESRCRARSISELAAPFVVRVHRPRDVDLDRVRDVEVGGLVRVVVDEEQS